MTDIGLSPRLAYDRVMHTGPGDRYIAFRSETKIVEEWTYVQYIIFMFQVYSRKAVIECEKRF